MMSAPSLRELQRAFAASLVQGDAPALTPWIAARGIDPQARLGIYRNAGYAIHVEVLEAVFPALRALVGEACFDALATRYTARRGSDGGNLQHFGRDFPAFVQVQHEIATHAWLPDVARLEWLRQDVLLAAQAPAPHMPDLLEALQQASAESIHLHLQPHVRVLCSAAPVWDLWHWALDPGEDTPDPSAPGQCVLLWRHATRMHMQRLDSGHAAFVQALLAGRDLAGALAGDASPAQVTVCLAPLLEHALISRIATTPARPVEWESLMS
jgi:hypothetical protein